MLSTRAVISVAAAVALLTAITSVLLVWAFSRISAEDAAPQVEALRLGLSIGLGAGGFFALYLATRRQQSTERDLAHREFVADVTRAHQERVADATEADALERRVTELYTRAADQLGSDKAPVRNAGLYSLERLAQSNPNFRQAIVNLLCAYLRMPFAESEIGNADHAKLLVATHDTKMRNLFLTRNRFLTAADVRRSQEGQVRLTAQRVLLDHLTPMRDDKGVATNDKFWESVDLDLSGAVLIDFDLRACEVRSCSFRSTAFLGEANFDHATFLKEVDFESADFGDLASFHYSHFIENALFQDSTFRSVAFFGASHFGFAGLFRRAIFKGLARFHGSQFDGPARFDDVAFMSEASFDGANPHLYWWGQPAHFDLFSPVVFGKGAYFDRVTFNGLTSFRNVKFVRDKRFSGERFKWAVTFREATFSMGADFEEIKLIDGDIDFDQAKIQLDASNAPQNLPRGWICTLPMASVGSDQWGRITREHRNDGEATSAS